MKSWIENILMLVGGFIFGRLGSAVDFEFKTQKAATNAIPALTEAVKGINRSLDGVERTLETFGDSLHELSRADEGLREELRLSRQQQEHRIDELFRKTEKLDQRIDALAAGADIYVSGAAKPRYARTPVIPPSQNILHTDCPAGHWVPPLDRIDFSDQINENTSQTPSDDESV